MKKEKAPQLSEVIKFLISGGICFLIQQALTIFFRSGVGLATWLAFFLAFLVAAAANYILSVLWIWPSAKGSNTAAKIGFLITSLIGLGLNELIIWILRLAFGEDQILFTVFGKDVLMYMINTCISTVLVMIWNFFTKRAILQSSLLQKWTMNSAD
ncbi:MAG: GtrA family protein [Oscillospiraceae bacterium]|nr:GtrA family protein [Oscillospiraceae bacterium]